MACDMYAVSSGPAGAPVVLLLHPMGFHGSIWDPHRAALAERYRLIVPDLPGHGRSGGQFTVAGSVDALHGLIGETAAGQPVHLAGLSLGGLVALSYATKHPVASLAIFGSNISPRMGLRRLVARVAPAGALSADVAKPTVLASMAEVAALDLRPQLPGIAAPTLVVIGTKDRPNLTAARQLADLVPGAKLRTITGAGHLWPQDRPADFVTLLTEWLTEATAG